MKDKKFIMVRDAEVTLNAASGPKGRPLIHASIVGAEGRFEHTFDSQSRVTKHLKHSDLAEIAARMNNGNYFFTEDGSLVDFRYGDYNGFVHSDKSIDLMASIIGCSETKSARQKNNTISREISLSNVWSTHDITVPLYKDGGKFESHFLYKWSPFIRTIDGDFQMVRLICANGMTGIASFLNTKVPVENRWEEHLEIASRQIQNKITSLMERRLHEMNNERASVAELLLIQQHALSRLAKSSNMTPEITNRLRTIATVASPELHCAGYKEDVFENKALAAQLPGHLSVMSAWNMVTEMASHTIECGESTQHALDKMANLLCFDRQEISAHAKRYTTAVKQSIFDDNEAAFFADANVDAIDASRIILD